MNPHPREKRAIDPREARWLLTEKYRGRQTPSYEKDLARLAEGEPLAYVIGHIPFLDAHIDLSSRPLIPRQETEYWVAEAIEQIKKSPVAPRLLLDVFSGSGAIGIALALHFPASRVYFGEKDPRFVQQIRKNVRLNKIAKDRARIYKSDIFSRIPKEKFSYIFANPPYVAPTRKSSVQKSVIRWEPRKAVFARDSGMQWIKKFIKESPSYLAQDGVAFIEFDPHQKKSIEHLARKAGFTQVSFLKDQYKRWRIARLFWHSSAT